MIQTVTVKPNLQSVDAKVAEYERLRLSGANDAQIRQAAEQVYGEVPQIDWDYLVSQSKYAV